jgi:hypothetical protein
LRIYHQRGTLSVEFGFWNRRRGASI